MNAPAQKAYKGLGMEWMASWYAKTTARDIEAFRKDAQLVASHTRSGDHVLEVAPGPGYLALELARLGRNVSAIDISPAFVKIARDNARAAGVAIDVRLGNASDMPFESARFDFVVCRAAFKNFREPVQALDEMYRVLREPGAALVIDLRKDFAANDLDVYLARTTAGFIDKLMMKITFNYLLRRRAYSKEQLKTMCAQTKFIRCEIYEGDIGLQVWLRK